MENRIKHNHLMTLAFALNFAHEMHLCAEIVVSMEKETSCTSPCIQFNKKKMLQFQTANE